MRYSGKLGIAEQKETSPGVWEEEITEHDVLGEVKQKSERIDVVDSILPVYRWNTSISIFARGIGPQDNSMIRYVTYAGARCAIDSIVSSGPRLTVYIGEVYNGPLPGPAPSDP